MDTNAPVYSFRAECPHDFDQFVKRAVQQDLKFSILQVTRGPVPNCIEPHVEIRTRESLSCLQNVIRGIDDSHVMLQTLRAVPLSENSLKRDFDLE